MNTTFLTKAALAVAASLFVSSQPAEAQRYRHDEPRHYSQSKKHHDWRWKHRRDRRAPVVSTEVRVQQELARRGYYRGVVDGKVGPGTRSAIRAYQRDHRLPMTGRIDHRLLHSLRLV